ncbi:DUF6626 family protein [Magnetovibrio blakemorei]|uniref:Uncharacterized protein n=1 Tax=Magnetovibrio blakemorei TaxID=28181 RepID=A0A1E5Q3Y0_9PROT|nr:hypothetical protein BEN30_16130 [Magnetovibrio blakemorei]
MINSLMNWKKETIMRLFELTHLPLHERIFEFLRLHRIIRNRADYSRIYLGRSRSYMNTLEYNGHSPSRESWETLREGLDSLHGQVTAPNIKEVLQDFTTQVERKLNLFGSA